MTFQEIHPLEHEEIQRLVSSSFCDLSPASSVASCETLSSFGSERSLDHLNSDSSCGKGGIAVNSRSAIEKLYQHAMQCMPNFIFRHKRLVDEPIAEVDEELGEEEEEEECQQGVGNYDYNAYYDDNDDDNSSFGDRGGENESDEFYDT